MEKIRQFKSKLGISFCRIWTKEFLQMIGFYTLGFLLTSGFILFLFFKYKKGFAWYSDGFTQHLVTLHYFRETLLNFFKTGQMNFFLWNLGTGFDMFGNLAYYIFGDFLSYFSIFVSQKYVYFFYYALVFLRIYLIGFAFLCYAKYHKMNRFSSVVGALMYTFCSFVLFAGVRHPYFSLAVALFPLLLLGIERYVKENKWGFYVFIVFFTAITNFYFAYSMFLILALYGVLLVLWKYKSSGVSSVFSHLFQLLGYSILGVFLASFLLLPTIYSFFHSARSGGMEVFPYAPYYFKNFLPSLITTENGYWRYFGVQSLILLTLPIFLRHRKKHYPFFLLMLFLLFPLLFSKLGSVFMGFSYPNNRWSYAYSFFFSFLTTQFLNEERRVTKQDFRSIGLFLLFYFFVIFVLKSSLNRLFIFEFFLFIGYFLLFYYREELHKKLKSTVLFHGMVFVLLFSGLFYTCSYLYDVNGSNYTAQFPNFNSIYHLYNTNYDKMSDFEKALSFIRESDSEFYRIGLNSLPIENLALFKNYNSIPYFYSIVPMEFGNLSKTLENREYAVNKEYYGFDYRTQITTLLGNRYYISTSSSVLPYGYVEMKDYQGSSKVYQNQYELPFGVLYTKYITEEEYQSLNPLEKENHFMKATVLKDVDREDNVSLVPFTSSQNNVQTLDYTIQKNSILSGNQIYIKPTDSKTIKLDVSDFQNGEFYVSLSNLRYTPFSKEEKIEFDLQSIKDIEKQKNDVAKIEYQYKDYQPTYNYGVSVKFQGRTLSESTQDITTSAYYYENFDYFINLGYYEKNKENTIEITFSKEGYYTFDEICVYVVSMEDYPEDVQNLKRSNFETVDYGNGYFKGVVNALESGVLQFQTTYSEGWEIFVDGEKVSPIVSNEYFLGTFISKGNHEIELRYHTPWLKFGFLVSGISGITCFCLAFHKKR